MKHPFTHSLTRIVLVVMLVLPSFWTGTVTANTPTPPPTPIPPNLNNSDTLKTDDESESPSQRHNRPAAIYGNQMALPPLDSNCADGECVFAVSSAGDDAGQNGVPGFGCGYSVNWNEVYVGRCENGTYITSGFRFPNVTLPKNAKIDEAYLVFVVDGPYANNQRVELWGDKSSYTASGGAAPFTATSTPATRQRTTQGARWDISASDAWELGEERQSVDIANILTEITSQSSWASGKAIAIIARTFPSGHPRGQHRRVIGWEREGNNISTARLEVRLVDDTPCYSVTIGAAVGGNGVTDITTPFNCTTAAFKFKKDTTVTFSLTGHDALKPYVFTHWSTAPANAQFLQDVRALTSSIKVTSNVFVSPHYYQKPPMVVVHGFQGLNSEGYQYSCDNGIHRYIDLKAPATPLPRTPTRYETLVGALPEAYLDKYDVWMAEWTTGPGIPQILPIGTPPIESNGTCLANQVNNVFLATGQTQKITVIAHSMGGLVTRACLSTSQCSNAINSVYTLGSPHNGIAGLYAVIPVVFLIDPGDVLRFCGWQIGVCQLNPTYIDGFNLFHPNKSTISYNFIGGYQGWGSFPGYWILNSFDDNDGLIGRRSAVGFGSVRFGTTYNGWKIPSQPYTLWIPRAHHIEAWGDADTRPDADYYFSADTDNPQQNVRVTGRAYDCLRWKQGILGASRPTYCEDALVSAQAFRSGLAQTSAALPQNTIAQQGNIQTGQTLTFTIPVDESGQSVFYLGWSDGVLDFTLTQPDGTPIDPAYAQANGNVVQYSQTLTPTEWTPPMAGYVFTNTQTGLWTLNITANSVGPSGANFVGAVAFQSERSLEISTDAEIYRPGDTAVLQAQLTNSSGGLTGATMTANIYRTTVTDTVTFTEQGNGLYTANYVIPNELGLLLMTVQATGTDGSLAYTRAESLLLQVVRDTIALTGNYSDSPSDSDGDGRNDTLEVQVGVNALEAGEYTVLANLETAGQMVAHTATPVTLGVGAHTITLSFSGDSLRTAGLSGPYTLTNLNILDRAASDLRVVTANNVWTTGSYDWADFGTCYSLIQDVDAIGAGTIATTPAPDCISAVGDRYSSGTAVTVTATANTGFTFLGWSGHLNATTATTQLTMEGDKEIQAFFWTDRKLQLTSMCSPNPTSYRVWRVRNYNPFALNFTWDVYNTSQSGSGSVAALQGSTPGEVTFQATTVSGSNTTRIFVNGVLQDTKASTTATCP